MAASVRASGLHAGVKVVTLPDRFDLHEAEDATPVLLRAVTESAVGVLVDMAAVQSMSSAGFRSLIATSKAAESEGKRTALIRVQPQVYKIFKLAALDHVFHFFGQEAEAIKAVWPAQS